MENSKTELKMNELDQTDRRILGYLRTHGRESYRQVARELDLHPATVIKRVEAMQKGGIIRHFGAQVDYVKLGFEFMALVDVRSSANRIPAVGAKLAQEPGVSAVWNITGHDDLVVMVACRTRSEFNHTIKAIGAQPYVERTNTHVVLNVIKNEGDFDLWGEGQE
ncbi:putative HTH-type transcriptional regulator [uncultured archaeon]|nr:putative HTH-type transcriptional regulator [uncultured archaeon]